MIDILGASAEILTAVGFSAARIQVNDREAILFEDATVLGFLFAYQTPSDLTQDWNQSSSRAIADYQSGLRRAGQKAWNTYIVLLAAENGDGTYSAALAAIEEDLSGTRKIVRMGVRDLGDVRAALLPLLPLQAAPKLEAVDIPSEIRQRATELSPRMIEAFLSSADESVVMQVLEEGP